LDSAAERTYPYSPWWAMVFIAALMGLIMVLAPFETFPVLERKFAFDYPWKLPDPTLFTRSVVWTLYACHQIGIWYLIRKAQTSDLKYTKGLHSVNVQALLLNAGFVLIHLAQTKWTYDGLAQDVPEPTALASVALMLFAIIIMENDRRGLFFGKKVPLPMGLGATVRKYHGYYFAWAITYTFWYHPFATTPGHLMGFFYMFMLFLQGSLFMTRAHVNRWWTGFIELMAVFHGATVAWFAAEGLGSGWWNFLWGGLGVFLITQMHGMSFKRWQKWALAVVIIGSVVIYGFYHFDNAIGIPRVWLVRYTAVFVTVGLIWLIMRPFIFAGKLDPAKP